MVQNNIHINDSPKINVFEGEKPAALHKLNKQKKLKIVNQHNLFFEKRKEDQ